MKRMTATVLFLTAISAPALAVSPAQRDMHSWDYVQQTANSALAPAEAPMAEHHEQRPYYHHEAGHKGKHHHGKQHHHDGKKHHHAKKDAPKAADKPAQEEPKQ